MRIFHVLLLTAVAAARLSANSLSFSLSPTEEAGAPASFPVTEAFSGTLTDTDTADTCDSENIDCLYLNFVTFSFDQDQATSHLSGDEEDFYLFVPGFLSDDGLSGGTFDSYTGPIFGITIDPLTPIGVYTGSVSIYGGYDSQDADNLLATESWTLVASPEPADFGLAILGIVAIGFKKRRVAA